MEPLESHQIWDASISGLILFITFLCDMLFMINNADIASYVNDNSTWCQCDLEKRLRKVSVKLFKWFHESSMKADEGKCWHKEKDFANCVHTRKLRFSKTCWCNNWQKNVVWWICYQKKKKYVTKHSR